MPTEGTQQQQHAAVTFDHRVHVPMEDGSNAPALHVAGHLARANRIAFFSFKFLFEIKRNKKRKNSIRIFQQKKKI